jgi:hypothetical protein
MTGKPKAGWRLALLAGAALCGPAPAAVKTRLTQLPPYAGAYQPQGVDERGIWMQADEDERELRDSKFVLHDPALENYVRQVLCNTVGADRCRGVRLYIVRVPYFNASMAPNGTMRVWTGLLLRVRSEAELAAVLGHEFAHFEERHTLASFRRQRAATDVVAWASFLGTSAPAVQQIAIGSIFSFSREQEREADIRAFTYLAASQYRAEAGADIWDRQMDEADATAAGRKQRSQRYDRVAFFADHPTSLERAKYLHTLATKEGNEGEDGATAYTAALSKWRGEFLQDQLKLNDFAGTEYLLSQLAKDGWTADLLFARGELYRLRGNPRDLVAAAQFYRDALAGGSADPLVHRSLGMVLLRSAATAEGCSELRQYLALRPDASDAAMVATLIEQSSTN